MPVYTLRRTQVIGVPPDRAWAFFSNPANLACLTPPELSLRVVSTPEPAIYAGMMIEYRVAPLGGFPLRWLTEITQVSAPSCFVDEQRVGPYALWHHEHRFRPVQEGATEIEDIITYVPPFGALGKLLNRWVIAPQLRRIFDFRAAVIGDLAP